MIATSPNNTSEVGLKTRHVFLDTEVYRRFGHNLNAKVLQTLLKQIKDHVCTLHTTDITLSEIKRQLGDMALETAQVVNKGNKELRRWQARTQAPWSTGPQKVIADVDPTTLAVDAVHQFDFALANAWPMTKHEALSVAPKDIFDLYFRRAPPFDKTDSKEFPDAFVVAALDRWCQRNNQTMYVVTKDAAMLSLTLANSEQAHRPRGMRNIGSLSTIS
jgi:PIN domain